MVSIIRATRGNGVGVLIADAVLVSVIVVFPENVVIGS